MSGFSNPIIGGGGGLVYPSIHSPDYVPGTSGWTVNKDGSAEFSNVTIPPGSGGSVRTFIQPAAPAAPNPGDIWFDQSAGYQINRWSGSAWVPVSQDASFVIQPGTISAALLVAGLVVAGIVDATTINAATFTGSVFQGTDFIINSSGEFYYSGAPAAGNLVSSDTNAAGTDLHGNAYLAGFTSYQPLGGIVVANNVSTANQLAWFTAATGAGPWIQIASITADVNSDLAIVSGNRIGVGNPLVALLGGVYETWHSLGSPSATGYTALQGRYRYEAIGPGYTVLEIQLQAGAGGGTAGVYTFAAALPAGYAPAGSGSKSEPLGFNGTVAAGSNFGSALIDGAAAANPGRVRIDIPALPANTIIGATIWLPLS